MRVEISLWVIVKLFLLPINLLQVCCICLARYADNDELRELPCIHVFHVECVDKWLKINASCPLCKTELGESSSTSPVARDSSQ